MLTLHVPASEKSIDSDAPTKAPWQWTKLRVVYVVGFALAQAYGTLIIANLVSKVAGPVAYWAVIAVSIFYYTKLVRQWRRNKARKDSIMIAPSDSTDGDFGGDAGT
jgi:hypothetical protein